MIPPACLLEDTQITPQATQTVKKGRNQISDILEGQDDRILLVCGPCSIHDIKSAMEYANRLLELHESTK